MFCVIRQDLLRRHLQQTSKEIKLKVWDVEWPSRSQSIWLFHLGHLKTKLYNIYPCNFDDLKVNIWSAINLICLTLFESDAAHECKNATLLRGDGIKAYYKKKRRKEKSRIQKIMASIKNWNNYLLYYMIVFFLWKINFLSNINALKVPILNIPAVYA